MVVVNAQRAACDLGHAHIGTEHQLLGLLQVSEGPTADALGRPGSRSTTSERRW